MSRVAPPGNRREMEKLLTDAELEVIRILCEEGGQPARNWYLIPQIRAGFELVAWRRLVRAYEEGGLGVEEAELNASIRLDLSLETM